ncbi:hypothetical protein [Metabacillus bambusae]|uniref:Peptidase M10 metallopeptidase domain-containing protein n=1 Tax=Metabacillus bambusae TaxID=2795218 RepID=A0ABS3N1C1_9BACI|nr:hypothetical protein [Metabacillus bambusae]MBO1512072.1 hypothetical protein [Metabacillus bambusae]
MLKIRQYFIILVLIFPFLVSFDSTDINGQYFASYQSPEGIQFVSYSKEWDKTKLIDLYKTLIKNKHGKEIERLKEVKINGAPLSSSLTKGSYHALTSTITLYQGDKYTEPSDYQETLSHEYGHHFAYHYFPSHHLPFSDWLSVRGIDVSEVRWDAFWNYEENNHAYYPQEIFADDYVLLYGATNEVEAVDVFNNEAFYLRTDHENQQFPNVLENRELRLFLEEESGIKIDDDRLLESPRLAEWNDTKASYVITEKPNVAYRLNLTFHNLENNDDKSEQFELYEITTDNSNERIEFSFDQIDQDVFSNYDYVTANIDVVDLSTSIGFQTEEITLELNM